MQDGACAMGRARWKGRNRTGGVASSTGFYLPDGGSEVAREIFLGHILGWRIKDVGVGNPFNCRCICPNLVTQTHLDTRGNGKAHKRNLVARFFFEGLGSQKRGFGADFGPCQK